MAASNIDVPPPLRREFLTISHEPRARSKKSPASATSSISATRAGAALDPADVPDDATESRAPQSARRAWTLVERTMTTPENYPVVLHDEA
jgi:hypothetical protein